MSRALGGLFLVLVAVWLIPRLLYITPVQAAAETALAWLMAATGAAAVVAALTVLAAAFVLGRSRPAWLTFVERARTVGAVIGCALVVVGLIHYRGTLPRGEIGWLVVGLVVLAGAGLVHWWVLRVRAAD